MGSIENGIPVRDMSPVDGFDMALALHNALQGLRKMAQFIEPKPWNSKSAFTPISEKEVDNIFERLDEIASRIHRYSMRDDETYKPLGDNRHIIFVNGENTDESTRIGKLVHDFKCTSANDMYYDVLAKRVRHFKETEGGNEHMCKLLEDMRNEAAEKAAKEAAREASITASIDTARRYGIDDSRILADIIKQFELTESVAKGYLLKATA